MDDIETTHALPQSGGHPWAPIESSKNGYREIPNPNAIQIDRLSEWNVGIVWAINIRREYLDLVAARDKGLAQPMHGGYRAAITDGRKI